MKLLDLFCGAGLAADGYAAAGFEIVGVDIQNQPDYPYSFFQSDALEVLFREYPYGFDVVHASPPCQLFTRAGHLRDAQGAESKETRDLLTPTLRLLRAGFGDRPIPGMPLWVVENVEDAARLMPDPVRLCGSMFGLGVQRHRMFSSNVPLGMGYCDHSQFEVDPETGRPKPWGVYHYEGDRPPRGGRTARDAAHAAEVMGVSRDLTWDAMKEGVPPSYTEHLSKFLLKHLETS